MASVVGALMGQSLRKKYFPPEGRIASLTYIYSPADIDMLRGRRLPRLALAMIAAKKRRLFRQELKPMFISFAGLLLVFGIVALTADTSTGRKFGVFLVGVCFCALLFVLNQASRWFTHSRHTHPSKLQIVSVAASKGRSGQTVWFGKAAASPHWRFSAADAATLRDGVEYTIYYVHDILLYLEETPE